MSVIFLLICISLVVAIAFLVAFVKAAQSGQFDDAYTPSVRILFEDEVKKDDREKQETQQTPE